MAIKFYKYFFLVLIMLYGIGLFGQEIVDSGYVKLKKCDLYFEVYGEGRPIVFLNGGPGNSSKGYKKYAKLLSDNYKVILFDQRGTGRSINRNRDNRISLYTMSKDLDQLRMHLGFQEWTVFGHSFGGEYAIIYTSMFRDHVSNLILSATPGYDLGHSNFQKFPDVDIEDYTLPELEVLLEIKNELDKETPNLNHVSMLKSLLRSRFYTQDPENYGQVINWFRNNAESRKNKRTKFIFNIPSSRIKNKLKKFGKPVLIIHGSNDFINILHPKQNHELFQNSSLKFIEQSGHMMILDQYDLYKEIIKDFLKSK